MFERLINDKHLSAMILLGLALLLLIVIEPAYRGLVMILALLTYGGLSSYYKERHLKLAALGSLIILSLINIGLHGLLLGIDFKGGVRLPITLDKPVTQDQMMEIVSKLKLRVSALGLTQINVKGVGNDQIYVDIPSNDEATIKNIENIITKQGVFLAVVDGKVVLEGRDIISDSVSILPSQYLRGADWGVQFSITRQAAEKFASLVYGKAGHPLYMFLDRPDGATIILDRDKLSEKVPQGVPISDVFISLEDILGVEGHEINLVFSDEFNISSVKENATYIVEKGSPLVDEIRSKGGKVLEHSEDDLYPTFILTQNGPVVDKWKAIGLLSSPVLQKGVTEGKPSITYSITGRVEPGSPRNAAMQNAREIESILKGGAFPVKLYIGSKTVIPAPLGEKFLFYSVIGILAALVAISLFVSFRYRRFKIIIPMVSVSVAELIVLISIMGSFTIDLAAMAGIIAAIGVSIDSQIVITDELLHPGGTKEEKLSKAFEIINNNAIVAIMSLIPLFFSSLVEIIGFATSSILGSLLGVLISRPAYAALVEEIL